MRTAATAGSGTAAFTVRDASGKPIRFIGCMTDISAQRVAEERIWQLANQDELTGLPNRKVFHEPAQHTGGHVRADGLQRAAPHRHRPFQGRQRQPRSSCRRCAAAAGRGRLKDSAGRGGTVFRLGGDEFAVIMPGLRPQVLDRARRPRAFGACAIRSWWRTRWSLRARRSASCSSPTTGAIRRRCCRTPTLRSTKARAAGATRPSSSSRRCGARWRRAYR